MGTDTPQNAVDWHELAVQRTKDFRSRAFFSVLVAGSGGLFGQPDLAALWLAATLLAQLGALRVIDPVRTDPAFVVSHLRERLFYVGLFLSAAMFASSGVLFWFACGTGGRYFALILLAGGIVNVAMQAGSSMRLLWTAAAPFVVLLLALPLVSLGFEPRPQREMYGLMELGSALMVLHLVTAAHRSVRGARRTAAAIEEARRERQRAEAASAAKSGFLAVMSHELRTPLNGVLGMAQVMAGDRLARAQRERLAVIRQSGESLLTLLNDLLDIAEIDTARLQMVPAIIDLGALAEQADTIFAPLAEAKRLEFSVRLLPSAGVARLGDPMRVRQVLHTLIANAVTSTHEGLISVMISGDENELVLAVADSGPGVDREAASLLFERIGPDDVVPAGRSVGAGLGLAISRSLAQLMGGDLTVRSKLGEGSVFTARLVLPRAAPGPVAVAPDPSPDPERLRVLAAEDNPTNQLVLRTLLEQVGLAVHMVGDGQQAVEAWRQGGWDLVLMDIQMPVMDGLAATRAIRAAEAEEGRPRTPIVAVTANTVAEQAEEYLAAGMDGLAPKPIQLRQLLTVIEAAIRDNAFHKPGARAAA